ncbi:ribitol-5-phosphate transferase FKTN isoform X1 [Danio rerio]|uniref:Ribitol-5-phosphate transferase n=1 Tax=Danio rerio TaxID=7955 RepID=A0A8M9PWZ8_DANRE|nr:fukutin isoform X1 [Danio rerio]|eukprot:XP_021331643.1 fukutin isoform X1 [Danio rerio]
MARLNRTFVLTLLIAVSSVFLLFQLYNYRLSAAKNGFNVLNNKGYLSGKEAHWHLLKRFLGLVHKFKLPVFLVDTVSLALLSQDAVLYRDSQLKDPHCSFLCTHRDFTSFALLGNLWKYDAALLDAASERGLELLEIHGKDPRLISTDDLTAKEIPLHFLFRFNGRVVHVVVLYERSGKYLWHGPLRLTASLDRTFAPFGKLDYGHHAGAYDRPELILTTLDGLNVRIPKNFSGFLHEYSSSHFLECRSREAKAFFQLYPEDTSPEAVDFRMRAKSLLHLASRVLFTLRVPFWLSSGTCLGWYRQCNIIPYSKDVDVGIWIKDYRPDIIPAFQKAGLPLKHKFGKVEDSLELSFQGNDVKLDIFFFYDDGDVVWNGGTQAKSGRKFNLMMHMGPSHLASLFTCKCINFWSQALRRGNP